MVKMTLPIGESGQKPKCLKMKRIYVKVLMKCTVEAHTHTHTNPEHGRPQLSNTG